MTELILRLEEEYRKTLEIVSRCSPDGEESRAAMAKLSEINKQLIALVEADEASFVRGEELKAKKAESKSNKVMGWAKIGAECLLGIAGLCLTSHWCAKGLTFEQTGAFTSKTGQWVSGIFRMFKR